MKFVLTLACTLLMAGAAAQNPRTSPPETAAATIGGSTITIKYSAPSVRGRQIFGEGGLVSHDKTAPVWRAGANEATAFHTDADLDLEGLTVPKGDYTLFVDPTKPDAWVFIVNKQTGQWGLTYDTAKDLGRVPMKMSVPPALIETLKYTIVDEGGNKGKIQLEWEHHIASVSFAVK
jgi:hypothetical protein